ncbi:ABC transporter ATP-binding protein [Neobacillus vireti]|uniref:Oligopeptide/dipeptide ABC transporter ATPase subunit n=1 Tax=Neobacillus vireti LMG 21834 TaxID=1131730 RepID=A0AB94II70_9BACI|nr:ABC transporter ATP-binding protein [Neobacillus vireti]ETI66747.1 oligopeptide/dipeptide ABC transporter ATPase subunit [Neobacillus vireti LMG 21834]KLT15354.1 peptide ABC transporter ATP-binding protein [Neobacillus vireti]
MAEKILEIKNLQTHFTSDSGVVKAVDGVTITVNKGETVGVVGESGCGKSVTSLSVMRLLKDTPGKIVGGTIEFEGKNLEAISEKEMRMIRGNEIAMIFQEPMTSLNPVYKIGRQIEEAVQLHLKYDKKQARQHAINMLKLVGIPRAEEIVDEFPYQLSGGMRQRVMIAMAMACKPKLLIADEPTTALDVTIQAQILDLMRKLTKEGDTAIMLITHDLGVVAEMCDRVVVMYAGKVVEEADVFTIFENPKHPYTEGLLYSVPKLGQKVDRLDSIPGNVPTPSNMPEGCKFAPRCPKVMDICRQQDPELLLIDKEHTCRCWLYQNSEALEV